MEQGKLAKSHRLIKYGLVSSAILLTALLVLAAAAIAAPPSVVPASGTFNEAPDYSSENWADPFDYGNSADLNLTPNVASFAVSNIGMNNGNLVFDAQPGGFIQPVQSGAFPHNRDSDLYPLDANKYSRLSIRMYSSLNYPVAGGILWFNCWGFNGACEGAMSFLLQPGWNTYDLQLTPNLMGIPWSGIMKSICIEPSASAPVHVEIDWMRLYQPSGSVNLTVQGDYASEVWWDADSDPTNNNSSDINGKGAGRLSGYVANGGTVTFPASAYPPGTYRFYTKQNGVSSAYSAPLVVDAKPLPLVIDPDVAGGDDYATVQRGDPWDFWQPTDGYVSNSISVYGAGVLRGGYAGPYPNDPQVALPLNGPINATVYHRLTYTIYYDGPFGLADAPGGGMVSRFIWMIYQGGWPTYHDSQDMIILPGWQTVSVDLWTPGAEDETSTNPIGWGGPASLWVSGIRFDPHEDPGGRVWWLDDIKLARNDRGTPWFNIRFQDNAWKAGTTAELYADIDSSGFNGTRIASGITVNQGENSYMWDGRGVGAGTWYVYAVLTDPSGNVGRAYSTGPVDMSPPPVNPYGSFDGLSGVPGGYQLSGWAIDPDTSDPIDVHIYNDGVFVTSLTADQARGDVGAHGFSGQIDATPGNHSVCAYGINTDQGVNTQLGCRVAAVPGGNPIGSLDGFGGSPGAIEVSGWTIDPDTASPIDVKIYDNGQYLTTVTANLERQDIGGIYPAYGAAHGYTTIVAGVAGNNAFCAYGVNTGLGADTLLGCKTVENSWQGLDKTAPTTSNDAPAGWQGTDFSVNLTCDDSQSGCNATYFQVDGGLVQSGVSVPISTSGDHVISYWSKDNVDRLEAAKSVHARLDKVSPVATGFRPVGWIRSTGPAVSADLADTLSGVDGASAVVRIDGSIQAGCGYASGKVNCTASGLSQGAHTIEVSLADNVGNTGSGTGSFTVGNPRDYYFTWYDDIGAANWLIMANAAEPAGVTDLQYDLWVGNQQQSLGGANGQTASPGESIPWRSRERGVPAGLRGGAVVTGSLTGDNGIVSQRSIWKGGNSLEEVLGVEESDLSDHYVWSWYDNRSPGWMNWVMVANPGDMPVYYEIRLAGHIPVLAPGQPGNQVIEGNPTGIIPAGQSINARFNLIGGPLEVRAWTDDGKGTTAKVVASQRVLSNVGTPAEAFNEVTGIPYSQLASDYLWTWYDNASPGAYDWVLIANPDPGAQLYYEILLDGEQVPQNLVIEGSASGLIPAGGIRNSRFKTSTGPLEVKTYTDSGKATPKASIASQRVLWGPSFEEVPGYDRDALADDYHWTWYDQKDPGTYDWVLISNINDSPVYYEITFAGQPAGPVVEAGASGEIAPRSQANARFAARGGPVEVRAWTDSGKITPANVMVSQRVIWHGYFNEVLGTVMN